MGPGLPVPDALQTPRCGTIAHPRGLIPEAGSTLTKQMPEGCFPRHGCSLSMLLEPIRSPMPTASSSAFLPLLPRARPLRGGRRAPCHATFLLTKNPGSASWLPTEHRGSGAGSAESQLACLAEAELSPPSPQSHAKEAGAACVWSRCLRSGVLYLNFWPAALRSKSLCGY